MDASDTVSLNGGSFPPSRPASILRPLEQAAVELYAFASQPDVMQFEEREFLAALQEQQLALGRAIEKVQRDFILKKRFGGCGA